jgi:acyl-CoA reductase-like NAD-dependent aldehyde dehydrogenase
MTGFSELDGFDLSKGSFYPPTVIVDVGIEDEIWQEEIFGPVVVVKRFEVRVYAPNSCVIWLAHKWPQKESDGILLANASKFGLGAGIWTSDLSRAHRVAASIDSGLCWVNTHHRNDPSSPW